MLRSQRLRNIWLSIRIFGSTIALAAFGFSSAPAADQRVAQARPSLITLNVAANPADDVTPLIYAQSAGLFTKAGLDVHIQRLTSAAGLPAAVASGTYDIGKTSVASLFAAHEKGLPFTIIAPANVYYTKVYTVGLLVAKDLPMPSARDFNGKIVSVVALHDIGQIALDAWIDQRGGDWEAVHYVELPMSATLGAIEQGRVFAAEVGNPILAEALDSGKVKIIPAYDAIAPSYLLSGWFTTSDWASKHRDAVKLFARVIAQAAGYTNAHPAETAPLLADFSSIPLSVIEHMPRVRNGTTVSASQIQPVIDAAAKFKMIDHSFPAQEIMANDAGN